VRDRLDIIAEQWRRERPELDVAPLATLGRLFRTAHLADRALRQPGLEPGWFDLLAALRRAGPPYELNPSALVETTMLTSGGITKRLDRLEVAGLVERRPDPDDRRGTLVRLTRNGKHAIDRAVETHVENEARLLSALTARERRELDALLRKLLATVEPIRDQSSSDPR
jgi:DNA-binding MarR family transcriptional regulator